MHPLQRQYLESEHAATVAIDHYNRVKEAARAAYPELDNDIDLRNQLLKADWETMHDAYDAQHAAERALVYWFAAFKYGKSPERIRLERQALPFQSFIYLCEAIEFDYTLECARRYCQQFVG